MYFSLLLVLSKTFVSRSRRNDTQDHGSIFRPSSCRSFVVSWTLYAILRDSGKCTLCIPCSITTLYTSWQLDDLDLQVPHASLKAPSLLRTRNSLFFANSRSVQESTTMHYFGTDEIVVSFGRKRVQDLGAIILFLKDRTTLDFRLGTLRTRRM